MQIFITFGRKLLKYVIITTKKGAL